MKLPNRKKLLANPYACTLGLFKLGSIALAMAAFVGPAQAQNVTEKTSATKGQSLAPVVVTGIRESQAEALNIKREASNIVDAVVAEDIGKLPDTNVAEALQRVAGVTVGRQAGEGKTISVRGLGKEFNITTLNGRRLASEDPGRQFNYDVMASELVSKIIVNKSSAANLPEGGIGAVIDINTYRPFQLADKTFVVSGFGVYDDYSGKTSPRMAALYSARFADDTLGVLVSANHSKRNLIQDQARVTEYDRDYKFDPADSGTTGLSSTKPYTIPKAFSLQRTTDALERTGGTLAVQWRPSDKLEINIDSLYTTYKDNNQQYALANIFDQGNKNYWEHPQTTAITPDSNGNIVGMTWGKGRGDWGQYPYVQNEYYMFPRVTTTSQTGVNVDYSPSDTLKLGFDISTSQARRTDDNNSWTLKTVTGLDSASYDWSAGNLPSLTYSPTNRGTLPGSLSNTGSTVKGTINEVKFTGEWNPHQLNGTVRFGVGRTQEEKVNDQYRTPSGNQYYGGFVNGQWFSTGPQTQNGFNFDVIDVGPLHGFSVPGYLASPSVSNFMSGVGGNMPRSWQGIDGNAMLGWLQRLSDATEVNYTPSSSWNLLKAKLVPVESFAVKESVISGYVDLDQTGFFDGMKYRLNPGVRIAKTTQTSAGYSANLQSYYGNAINTIYGAEWGNASAIEKSKSYTDFLPSLNIALYPRDDLLVRFAAAKVLSRAPITNLRPGYDSVDVGSNTIQVGNPDLDPFRAIQLDATAEWYFSRNGALLFGAFYKDIDTFIANGKTNKTVTLSAPLACSNANWCYWNDNGKTVTKTFDLVGPFNSRGASIAGFDMTWQQDLGDLSPTLKGFGVNLSGTYAEAKTDLRDKFNNSLSIEGLSKYSYNVVGYYETKDFGVRLAYNWRDQYLLSSGANPVYHAPIGWLDGSIYYNYDKNVSFNVYASNILNSADKATYGKDGGPFNGNLNYLSYTGVQVGAGLRIKF